MSVDLGRRRRQVLGGIVLAAVVLVIVGLDRLHADRVRSDDASLWNTGRDLHAQVRRFQHHQHSFQIGVRLHGHAAVLTGAVETQTRTNSTDVADGTSLKWYRNFPDPRLTYPGYRDHSGYSFCLSRAGRSWRISVCSGVGTTIVPDIAGPCVAAPSHRRSAS